MQCCQLESMKPMVELYVTQIDQAMYGEIFKLDKLWCMAN